MSVTTSPRTEAGRRGRLTGKVAVVTGSSSGNERAMVRPFLDDPELNQVLHENSPWSGLGTAEDVADAAVFLASAESRWVTGSMLTVDGGYTAG